MFSANFTKMRFMVLTLHLKTLRTTIFVVCFLDKTCNDHISEKWDVNKILESSTFAPNSCQKFYHNRWSRYFIKVKIQLYL